MRYLSSFQTYSGSIQLTFPTGLYEWQSSAPLRIPQIVGSGSNYAYDILKGGIALSAVARETVRCILIESSIANEEAMLDEIRSKCLLIGRGIIYTTSSDGSFRWAYARITELPTFTVNGKNNQSGRLAIVFSFERYSDWFANNATVVTEAVTANAETWTVNNPGNLYASLVEIRLEASGAAGIINPIITNQTLEGTNLATVLATLRDSAGANDIIKFDTSDASLKYSTNNGSSYADDIANYVVPSTQAPLTFLLAPGNNTIRYNGGGTPNLDVVFTFYAPFAA